LHHHNDSSRSPALLATFGCHMARQLANTGRGGGCANALHGASAAPFVDPALPAASIARHSAIAGSQSPEARTAWNHGGQGDAGGGLRPWRQSSDPTARSV
jgi:hypothetical protein